MNNKWKTYLAAVMILCMLFVQTGIVAAEEAPLFSLEADTQSVEVGEEYTIRIHVDGASDIYGFEASITYNPDIVEFIADESEETYEGFSIEKPDDENGKLLIAFTRTGKAEPISGDTNLYIMKFKVLSEGTAQFVLEYVKVVDSSENATVYTIGTGISVICEDKGTGETPTPTPTASPTPTPTSIPTSEPTATPVPTTTDTPSATPTASPTPGETMDLSDKTQTLILDDGTVETNLPESVLEDVEEDLDEGGTVAIQMGEGDTGQSFKAPVELFKSVADKKGSVSLDYGSLQLTMPGSAIDVEKICQDNRIEDVSGLQVKLKVREVPAEELEPGMDESITGKVFQFTLDVVTQDGESVQVTSFTVPIELKIPETEERPKDYVEGTRNVYKIDVDPPQYCYTYFDGENYVAELDGFSRYAVMEYKGSFNDVLESHWAKDYIRVLAAKDIVEGVGDNIFNPGRNVTRAEFAKMIAGALNLKAPVYMGMFNDVASEAWYASYVEAAAQAGIVQGHGNGRFDPDSTITREQMAVMVMNAYAYITGTEAAEIGEMYDGKFSDLEDASDWARDSIKAAYVKGFVNGMPSGKYVASGFSQRDQAAAIIVRLLQKLNKL